MTWISPARMPALPGTDDFRASVMPACRWSSRPAVASSAVRDTPKPPGGSVTGQSRRTERSVYAAEALNIEAFCSVNAALRSIFSQLLTRYYSRQNDVAPPTQALSDWLIL